MYFIGTFFYLLGMIFFIFFAPQKHYVGGYYSGHYETIMNIPTMIYGLVLFVIGSMFFVMGYCKSLLKPTQVTDNKPTQVTDNSVKPKQPISENDTETFTETFFAITIAIIVIFGICYFLIKLNNA